MSIQLALDGHSFSIAGGSGVLPEAVVSVEILTPRTLLVPEELFAPSHARTLLAADGKAPLTGEEIVHSAPVEGIIALMAVPAQALQQLREQLDADTVLEYTTPLLVPTHPTKPTVLLQRAAGYLYVRIYNGGLRLAEVLPAPTETDIRYALERLETEFPLKQYTVQLAGKEKRRLEKLVGNRFKSVRCE
ncbi:MAG: DUF3822 family protein [Alistipes senegalensis]|nr:DUF3822 family protein [Bacteroides cellulosilyticus]MCM1352795.1 DUF3822 family protein [Alistipes senegalensis]